MDTKRGVIDIRNPKAQQNEVPKQFSFDAIYDWKYSLSVQHHSSFHFKFTIVLTSNLFVSLVYYLI